MIFNVKKRINIKNFIRKEEKRGRTLWDWINFVYNKKETEKYSIKMFIYYKWSYRLTLQWIETTLNSCK
jgi:hypothetical protein